jgi:hypothetical protein
MGLFRLVEKTGFSVRRMVSSNGNYSLVSMVYMGVILLSICEVWAERHKIKVNTYMIKVPSWTS